MLQGRKIDIAYSIGLYIPHLIFIPYIHICEPALIYIFLNTEGVLFHIKRSPVSHCAFIKKNVHLHVHVYRRHKFYF